MTAVSKQNTAAVANHFITRSSGSVWCMPTYSPTMPLWLVAGPFIVSVNEFGFCIDVGLFDRSVYEPVNATVLNQHEEFLYFSEQCVAFHHSLYLLVCLPL